MKTITFVTCMHGNERMPALALVSAGITQLVANPESIKLNKRYVDSDLNAAFGKEVVDIETCRAAELLALIPYDTQIVDFHSYETDYGPFTILVDARMLPLALKAGVKRIVLMKFNIKKGHALINYRNGISVEVGQHNDPKGFEVTRGVAERILVDAEPMRLKDAELYEVYDEITEVGEYKNFELHKDGFYPVFAEKNSYGNNGLKARLVTSYS